MTYARRRALSLSSIVPLLGPFPYSQATTYQSTLVFRFYTMAGRQCCVPMSALDDQLVPDLVPGTFRLFL